MPWKTLTAAIAALACCLTDASAARAHSVFIFAWPQGDSICTDSYFSRKSPVRGGEVSVLDASGQVLAKAKTDDKGSVCFDRPATGSDLTFVVEAGEGHRAEFKLGVADLPSPVPRSAPASPDPEGVAVSSGAASVPTGPDGSLDALRAVIRQEFGAQLGPITRALTEADDKSPTLKDIIGGLGWLAGLSGLAFWRSGRKLRQKST